MLLNIFKNSSRSDSVYLFPVLVGLLLIVVAVYTLRNPMSGSRNWVAADEWVQDPEQAEEKQQKSAFVMSVAAAGLGLFFILLGLLSG